MDLEGTKLRSQLTAFQSELETIRLKVQKLTDENESLRHELRRSAEEKLSGVHPNTISNFNNDSKFEIQKRQIELLYLWMCLYSCLAFRHKR
ncbi:unnamed protein product [Adineta steineri]|nr:unnamed protein product [Adineta steineri]